MLGTQSTPFRKAHLTCTITGKDAYAPPFDTKADWHSRESHGCKFRYLPPESYSSLLMTQEVWALAQIKLLCWNLAADTIKM